MKLTNKKNGFTIVELVIVIAVIAILAAVLIPTFSGVVGKANESAAKQIAANAIKSGLLMTDVATLPDGTFVAVDSDSKDTTKFDYGYKYTGNSIEGPKTLYNNNVFVSSLLTAPSGNSTAPLNTILIKPDHIKATPGATESDPTTYSADELLTNMLIVACGGTLTEAGAPATGDSVAVSKVGDVYKIDVTITGASAARSFNCYTSVDLAKNVVVFTIMN